jgi:hypothetical protein
MNIWFEQKLVLPETPDQFFSCQREISPCFVHQLDVASKLECATLYLVLILLLDGGVYGSTVGAISRLGS